MSEEGDEPIEAQRIAETARDAALEKQGRDVRVFDLHGISSVTDFTVLVSGTSPPHLKALAGSVEHALKEQDVRAYRKAGKPESGWLVLDYVDVVIHVLSLQAREYYAIDELWAQAPVLE